MTPPGEEPGLELGGKEGTVRNESLSSAVSKALIPMGMIATFVLHHHIIDGL